MNEENCRNHHVKGDAVEGPVNIVSRDEVLQALIEMEKSLRVQMHHRS